MLQNNWTTAPPSGPGLYWFYGDPFQGEMGIDYKEGYKPEPELHLVNVCRIASGELMATTAGQCVPLRLFNKQKRTKGYLGYFQEAALPEPPTDTERFF